MWFHYLSQIYDNIICDRQINGGNSENKIKLIIIVLLVIPKNHWKQNCS